MESDSAIPLVISAQYEDGAGIDDVVIMKLTGEHSSVQSEQ